MDPSPTKWNHPRPKPDPNPTQTRPKFSGTQNLGRVWVALGSDLDPLQENLFPQRTFFPSDTTAPDPHPRRPPACCRTLRGGSAARPSVFFAVYLDCFATNRAPPPSTPLRQCTPVVLRRSGLSLSKKKPKPYQIFTRDSARGVRDSAR